MSQVSFPRLLLSLKFNQPHFKKATKDAFSVEFLDFISLKISSAKMCYPKREAESEAWRAIRAPPIFISHLPDAKQLESISEIDHSPSLSSSSSFSPIP